MMKLTSRERPYDINWNPVRGRAKRTGVFPDA
jgi:hypothetical protein